MIGWKAVFKTFIYIKLDKQLHNNLGQKIEWLIWITILIFIAAEVKRREKSYKYKTEPF